MIPRVLWITGARGLIGSYLFGQAALLWPQCRVVAVGRPELDLTEHTRVRDQFLADSPSAVIHCAAISRSPICQADPALARRHNVDVTRHLAELAAGIPLVFFSTDLVFDGTQGHYTEDDSPNPRLIYAETKVEAEQIVRTHEQHLIIRTSLNYGHSDTGTRSFNEEMVTAWRQGRTLKLFTDEFRSPIAATETARAVLELLERNATGTVHVAGTERVSRWELGQLLAARHPEVQPRIEPSSLRDFTGPPRPADVSLKCSRAEQLLGRPLPRFRDWIAQAEPLR
ncbi:MAG: SDR family oxidoreductase [Verrucomicrobia bacterium]|nr:SDR family oxidoreductase [Verrucomicrobiota bacterium]